MAYEINYDDQKFKDVETEKQNAISDLEKTYSGMINDSDAFYQEQIDATKEWEKKQTELQNQQTDFAIEKIEQQKDQAKTDYNKEQSAAYQDWKKQSDPTGVRAEQIADMGMQNTGYSESSQVSMFNTYQNRVATARESYNRIILDFDNSITEARLQNNSALAEIAYNSLQKRLELNLDGFQYKNTLLLDESERKTELEQTYYERWQDVLEQMNTENELAEEARQFDEELAEEQRQFDLEYNATYNSSSSSSYYSGDSGTYYSSKKKKTSNDDSGTIEKDNDSDFLPAETSKSILELGQGPISAENLAGQVADGTVIEYTGDSGNPVFKYNNRFK